MIIGLLGMGTIGSGVFEIAEKLEGVTCKKVLEKRFQAEYITDNIEDIVKDPEIELVVETMGGLHPAYEFACAALENGKHFVTANKLLVSVYGPELTALAKKKGVAFLYGAACGGGIAYLANLEIARNIDNLRSLGGILNGTTNFILTKMIYDKMSFDDALALAQDLGYAERNPSADVDGHDSCRKICILASLAFGRHVYPEQVSTEGIRDVTLDDVVYADIWGGSIKLLGVVKPCGDGKLDMCVAPMLIPKTNQLWRVDDVFNGILACGNATGDVLFYGRGAGKMPTASAVVADVIDCTKHFNARKYLYWEKGSPDLVMDSALSVFPVYIRAAGMSADELTAAVEKVCGPCQKLTRGDADGEAAFIVPAAPYGEQCAKRQQLESSGVKVLGFMRIFAD